MSHARLLAGHPRLTCQTGKTWMAGTSPAMTVRKPSVILSRSCESSADRKLGLRGEFAGGRFRPVGRLDPQDLDAPIGADHGETVGAHIHNLTELAADAFGVARRQRLRIENLQHLAVDLGPAPGRRVASADQ